MEFQASQSRLPPKAEKILIWHQGALGDVLLAGPALQTVAAHYPAARLTLVGGLEHLGLLPATLPVEQVFNGQRALWLDLYQDCGPIDGNLLQLLSRFDLAVIFTPQRQPEFLERWRRANLPRVVWVPSFSPEVRMPIHQLQQEHLQSLGFKSPCQPFHLVIPDQERQSAQFWLQTQGRLPGPLVALAPGSGHQLKNWPLPSYVTLAQRLEEHYQAQVWWVLGPAEDELQVELQKTLGVRACCCLNNLPLGQLAAILAEFQLFVGNDSGVTHLAAVLGQPQVVAIFGPSDPVIWGPLRGAVIAAQPPCAPCTRGRQILCPDNVCLKSLAPEKIFQVIEQVFPA